MENVISIRASELTSTSWKCEVCNKPKKTKLVLLGKERVVRCNCECETMDYEAKKAEEQRRKQLKAIEKLKRYSLMDSKFHGSTLTSWDEAIGSPKLKKTVNKYVENWLEMKENNIGLLIHGNPGIGKTYAAFAIANEIMQQYRAIVVAVNTIGLLARIRETFNRNDKEAEIDIIRSLEKASLLILDDLGAEQKTNWSTAMLYQIIDARYRSGKPLILTTNLPLDNLRDKLISEDAIDRTYDRIAEICLPIQVRGKSNRAEVAKTKREQLMELLKKEN
ncbi:phage DNA replication protein (predicted replicative helicase loader) [Tindallia californiensis]|uniref:Phage DNA replication protein (Predicted replicative helicase loader) n=1 Tax=Tindallia californiensis TaxID=159292 RepID=A0A1H3RF13_9FIRM|nr:phage DNA replication protein (predicted replicative helicase loader) [Tindallia californiensis]